MKRALIITYYWPPAGGPGVQRWLKFATYFREYGVDPVVYIPKNPHYPILDNSMVLEVPQGIEIIKTTIKEPNRFSSIFLNKKARLISSGIIAKKKQSLTEKLMLWVRGNFFIPDTRVGWVKPSVAYLQNYLSENPVDIVITTGPPHSLHLIGLELKKTLNIPWLADFRDPWTTIFYHKFMRLSNASVKKHKRLEANVLNSADGIVVTSPTTKKEFEKITKSPIDIITNGYDISEDIIPVMDSSFSLVHVGSLLSERNPIILWEVLSEICKENISFSEDFKLKLIGTVSEEVLISLKQYDLIDKCEVVGYVSHKEAQQLQHNAQLLLLIEMDRQETRSIIPGKLFEYIAARRPIISLGPEGSDISSIISETNSGDFFTYGDGETLRLKILSYYAEFKRGNLKVIPKNIEQYSRRVLTKKMTDLIKGMG